MAKVIPEIQEWKEREQLRFAKISSEGVRSYLLAGALEGEVEGTAASMIADVIYCCVNHPEWAVYWNSIMDPTIDNLETCEQWVKNLSIPSMEMAPND